MWSDECQNAFTELKQKLIHSPISVYPNFESEFEIYTDAIGAVLMQRVNGRLHPVAYASRMLNKHERNYSTSEKEM